MKKFIFLAPILVIALSIGGYALLHVTRPEPEKRDEPPRAVSVFVRPVERQPVKLDVVTQGEVRPRTQVDIVSQVGGRVMTVSSEFIEGGIVEPGVPLVTIEDTDYQLALTEAEARVAEAEVEVQQALADADVARKQLEGQRNTSPLALKIPQVAEARSRLKAASANLELARLNLSRTRIVLPFRGRVTETLVDVGQYVAPGTPLGHAFSNATVEVRLPLTDTQLAYLNLPIGYLAPVDGGPHVHFTATVAGKEQHWDGHLARLDAALDSSTRLLYGTAEVVDPYGAGASQHGMPLAVGLFVTARIEGRELADARVIPRSALRAGGTVYVVNSANRLEMRHVEVAHSSESQAVIASGLHEGEHVVVSSIRNAIDGMALETLPAPDESIEQSIGRQLENQASPPHEDGTRISETSHEVAKPEPSTTEG